MIGFIVILLLLAAAVGAAYYYYTQTLPEPSIGPSAPTKSGGSTLTITENGASLTENYRIMPKREKYINQVDVARCHGDNQPEFCNSWNEENGLAFVYDSNSPDLGNGGPYTECPGGGHDCWYTETYEEDGTLIAITNKQGESLLDKMADDLWSGKIDMNHQTFSQLKDMVKFENGNLLYARSESLPNGRSVEAGEPAKPSDIPGSIYYIFLLVAMKLAGEEKPQRIVLNIKGAKEAFNNFLNFARRPPPEQ